MFGLVLPSDVTLRLHALCVEAGNYETGGILIGRYSPEHDRAIVAKLSGAPGDSSRGTNWFRRGIKGLQPLLIRLWQENKYYIGEWHFHPNAAANPSPDDSSQMFEFSRTRTLKCPEPVLLILGGNVHGVWHVSGYVYRRMGDLVALGSRRFNLDCGFETLDER
jgi:integrative and conjugative element protein (TIGR02256 family)